jgi:hypothetical protein
MRLKILVQMDNNNRLYILIDENLAPIYGAVQGGHAIAQWMLEHSDNLYWKNETVVYLTCNIEKMLYYLKGEDISIFREKIEQLDRISFQDAHIVDVDAEQDYKTELLSIKKMIWELF